MSDIEPNLGQLEEQLFDIPAPKFVQLVAMLETRLEKTTDPLSVLMILSKVRPRMTMLRPPRRPSLKRLFCRPFEDLLYTTKSKETVLGKLPRSAIEPIWRLLVQDGDRELLGELSEELTSAGADANQASATGISLWHHAAEVLRGAIERAKSDKTAAKELIQRLRGEHIYIALQDVVEMLEMAEDVETLHAVLPPKPIQEFNRNAIDQLKSAIDRVGASSPRKPELLLFVLMARMEKPWLISEVIDKLAGPEGRGDKQISALAAAALVANTEEQLTSLSAETAEAAEKDPETLARHVTRCVRGLEGAKGVVKTSGNAGLDKQLERARRSLGEMVRINLLEGAERRILEHVMSTDAKKLVPVNFWEKRPDEDQLVVAEKHAIALRLCAQYAEELGLEGQVEMKLEQLRDSMEERASKLLEHVRQGGLAAGQRATAEANLYCTVRLLELVAGPDRADHLRREGLDALYGGG